MHLRMLETVTSATASEGQRFNMELDDAVRVNGQVVIPAGTKAVGTVTSAKKRGFLGRGGELNVSLDYIILNDQRIRLRANSGREGQDKVGTAVVLTVLFGPLGLLKRGHDISINAGTEMTAYIDQTTEVEVSLQQPQQGMPAAALSMDAPANPASASSVQETEPAQETQGNP